MSYQPKVYRKQGGSELVVSSGGKITVESGGELERAAGSIAKLPIAARVTDLTLAVTDLYKIWTTRGAAGAVNFTLPAAATAGAGAWVEFYNVANQNMTVTGADEELVVFNDLTADSIAYSTAGELIGGGFRCICDGTSWIVVPLATEVQTVTVASA